MSSKNTLEFDKSLVPLLIESVSNIRNKLVKLDYYDNIFLSFLRYIKEKDDFDPIHLINTNSIFAISKEYQKKGRQSYVYARKAINDKDTIICGNIHQKKCPWHNEIKKEAKRLGIKSVISSPGIYGKESIGVVNTFYTKELRKNSPEKNQLMANSVLTASLLGQQLLLKAKEQHQRELLTLAERAHKFIKEEFLGAADTINEFADAIKSQVKSLKNSIIDEE